MPQQQCVHVHPVGGRCDRFVTNPKTHGWLCAGHYQHQQSQIPPGPRLPQARWTGMRAMSDDEVIAGIISSDQTAIALGVVVTQRRGALDPVYFRTLEPAQVV